MRTLEPTDNPGAASIVETERVTLPLWPFALVVASLLLTAPSSVGAGEACDCCAGNPTRFETTIRLSPGEMSCGEVNQRICSNDTARPCGADPDCDLGSCNTAVSPGRCTEGGRVRCTTNEECAGECVPASEEYPIELGCGGLYMGGGQSSLPLPIQFPDNASSLATIRSCNQGRLSLGPVSRAAADQATCTEGRKCKASGTACIVDADCGDTDVCEDRCIFGAPLPVPNAKTPAISVCLINVFEDDLTGKGRCEGDLSMRVNLRSVIHLTGDLLSRSQPPNVEGLQPCPICSAVCAGGSKSGFPCTTDDDCEGGACGAASKCRGGPRADDPCSSATDCPSGACVATQCLGGVDRGKACLPETSGAALLGTAYPTSRDCTVDPSRNITKLTGGLPISMQLRTGATRRLARDLPRSKRVFCGYCRDMRKEGTLRFEGDPTGPPCTGCREGEAVPCFRDEDCADGDPYESCAQRNPGAFSHAAATEITTEGAAAGCLDAGSPNPARLVSLVCVPPTFNPMVDAIGSLPGPGLVSFDTGVRLEHNE